MIRILSSEADVTIMVRLLVLLRPHLQRWARLWWIGVGIAVLISSIWGPGLPSAPLEMSPGLWAQAQPLEGYEDLLQQGQEAYRQDRFEAAVELWQRAVQVAEADPLQQAQALSNLSLAHQKLGQWQQATSSSDRGFRLLQPLEGKSPAVLQIQAQAFNTQGHLRAGLGQFEGALGAWQRATQLYSQAGDPVGQIGSQLNQAQALQSLGLYRQALDLLSEAVEVLEAQPDSILKVTGLRSLGNALRVVRDPELSQQALLSSLRVAEALNLPHQQDLTVLSLGNTARSLAQGDQALQYYQQASRSPDLALGLQAQLNQLSLLVEQQQWVEAERLWPQILDRIEALPLGHATLYGQINLSQSLMSLRSALASESEMVAVLDQSIVEILSQSTVQAQQLGDRRAESYSLGQLGTYFEERGQLTEALSLTEESLVIAQGIQAPDITYLWHWQLGRIYRLQERRSEAIAQYSQAVQVLQALRTDLVTVNPEVQFSFRDSVEPIYRQLVSLLLEVEPVPQESLLQARELIESLQLAELDNFFRDACLDTEPLGTAVQLDQVDPRAAVFYPILLPDRMEVILSLPHQPLQRHGVPRSRVEIETVLNQFRQQLENRTNREFITLSQQLYDWLIRPALGALNTSTVDTLVFVLDGPLRNVPMAALQDGDQFLIESYGIALTPGLQLLDPQPLQRGELQALVAGLTEGRQGFAPLINVEDEIEQIQTQIGGLVLKDPEFTNQRLRQELQRLPFPIVHIATHGQFSSNADDTFILTWDDRLDIPQLDGLLRLSGSDQGVTGPIELLTLSACQTAIGDNRAALGLAGVAVRAGARSTVASLWYVNDQATVPLISQFYRELTDPSITKAKALQRAQQQLLAQDQYRHPIYWAPFILVGNWL